MQKSSTSFALLQWQFKCFTGKGLRAMLLVMAHVDKEKLTAQVCAFLDQSGHGGIQRLADASDVSRETIRRVRNGDVYDESSAIKVRAGLARLAKGAAGDSPLSGASAGAESTPQAPELFPGAALVVEDLRRLADLIEQTRPEDLYPLRTIEAGLQGIADSLPDLRALLARVRQQP